MLNLQWNSLQNGNASAMQWACMYSLFWITASKSLYIGFLHVWLMFWMSWCLLEWARTLRWTPSSLNSPPLSFSSSAALLPSASGYTSSWQAGQSRWGWGKTVNLQALSASVLRHSAPQRGMSRSNHMIGNGADNEIFNFFFTRLRKRDCFPSFPELFKVTKWLNEELARAFIRSCYYTMLDFVLFLCVCVGWV